LPMKKITISQWLCNKVLLADSNINNVVNIPIGVETRVFKRATDIRRRPNTIAMLYSLAPNKGSDCGLAAIERCKDLFPDLRAVLFGPTSRFRPNGIPKWITYAGVVSEKELVQIYNQSKIYVCSSIAEGFALPPAEAMACGCAVVSTECGGNEEYAVANVNALLSRPNDTDGLAANIQMLLENDELRIQIAQHGYEMIQQFTWERSTDTLLSYLISNSTGVN